MTMNYGDITAKSIAETVIANIGKKVSYESFLLMGHTEQLN